MASDDYIFKNWYGTTIKNANPIFAIAWAPADPNLIKWVASLPDPERYKLKEYSIALRDLLK